MVGRPGHVPAAGGGVQGGWVERQEEGGGELQSLANAQARKVQRRALSFYLTRGTCRDGSE